MGYSLSGQTEDNMSSASSLSQRFGGINKANSNNTMLIVLAFVVAVVLVKKG